MHTLPRVTAFKGRQRPSPLYFCQVLTGWQAAPRSNHECHDFHSGFSDTRPRANSNFELYISKLKYNFIDVIL